MSGKGDDATPIRSGNCENCARDDAELVEVHRVYVTPAAWDTEGSSTEVETTEWWCFSCRSIYPHRVAAD